MSGLVRRRLLRLFLIVPFTVLLFSASGNGETSTEAYDGVAKLRLLLGLNTLGPRPLRKQHHGHQVAPAPAPAPAVGRAHLPLLHKDARLPDPVPGKVTHNHKRGNGTAQSPRDGGRGHDGKKSPQLVIVAAAAALSGAYLWLSAISFTAS